MSDDLQRRELPLPDYDQLETGALSAQLSHLDASGIEQLLAYERDHGNRRKVLDLFEHRLAQLANGAEPAPGAAEAPASRAPAAEGGSKVGPSTQGPTLNPPSQGVPTNPAQPRT